MPAGAIPSVPGVLRVGVVDGMQPCSYREGDGWRGIAVDLWERIATRDAIPFVFSEWPSIMSMLQATRDGRLDVAAYCIHISPERLKLYRLSLPFQEDGQSVMVGNTPLDLGGSFMKAFLSTTLLELLGGFLVISSVLSALIWKVESYDRKQETAEIGRLRMFTRVFQGVAATGGSTVAVSTRGNLLVITSYLVRTVAASLLVGYFTVNVMREAQIIGSRNITQLKDLLGLRVGLKAGTVSENLIKELNASGGGPDATIVPVPSIGGSTDELESKQIDALLADNLQLRYLMAHPTSKTFVPSLAIQGIRPEMQAFGLSPELPIATVEKINLSISILKRSGELSAIHKAYNI